MSSEQDNLLLSDPFWSDSPQILLHENRFIEFFPMPDMTDIEKLNAIARFGIYLGISLSLFKKEYKYLFVTFIILLITYIIFNNSSLLKSNNSLLKSNELFTNLDNCQKPTKDNPMMNVLPTDYLFNPKRPSACDVNDPLIRQEMKNKFSLNAYKDVGDVFDVNSGSILFNTMPNTVIPDQRDRLTKWLYTGVLDCKSNTEDCPVPYNNELKQSFNMTKDFTDLEKNQKAFYTHVYNPLA